MLRTQQREVRGYTGQEMNQEIRETIGSLSRQRRENRSCFGEEQSSSLVAASVERKFGKRREIGISSLSDLFLKPHNSVHEAHIIVKLRTSRVWSPKFLNKVNVSWRCACTTGRTAFGHKLSHCHLRETSEKAVQGLCDVFSLVGCLRLQETNFINDPRSQ